MNLRHPLLLCFLNLSLGCGAVYPEISTPLAPVPSGRALVPPPPDDLLYIAVGGAQIPAKTRDGQAWDSEGGALPDPFLLVFVNDKEIIKTPIESNTLSPTWPNQVRSNHRIAVGAQVRFELWDSNPINNRPICVKNVDDLHEGSLLGEISEVCDGGARVQFIVTPARPRLGLGFYYELKTKGIAVTRVLRESPAARAGLKKGDEIISVQGEPVTGMGGDQIRDLINANAELGVKLEIGRRDSDPLAITLKDGPVYPSIEEGIEF